MEDQTPLESEAVDEMQRLLELYAYNKEEPDEISISNQTLRSLIVKELLARGANNLGDKLLNVVVKTLGEIDKMELAKKRLKQDEANGSAMTDLVSKIASKLLESDRDVDLTSAAAKVGGRKIIPDTTDDFVYDPDEMKEGNDINADSLDELLEDIK